jgi:hypothetical protein
MHKPFGFFKNRMSRHRYRQKIVTVPQQGVACMGLPRKQIEHAMPLLVERIEAGAISHRSACLQAHIPCGFAGMPACKAHGICALRHAVFFISQESGPPRSWDRCRTIFQNSALTMYLFDLEGTLMVLLSQSRHSPPQHYFPYAKIILRRALTRSRYFT